MDHVSVQATALRVVSFIAAIGFVNIREGASSNGTVQETVGVNKHYIRDSIMRHWVLTDAGCW